MGSNLIIFGFGGHARSVADVALCSGYNNLMFFDENVKVGENFKGHPAINSLDEVKSFSDIAFSASGCGFTRKNHIEKIKSMKLKLAKLVSPNTTLGIGCIINDGTFIGHHAHIGPEAIIGTGCIINTGAIIEHEVVIGDYSHVSVSATIAGRSIFGAYSMLGANATIIDKLKTVDNCVIGAGAVVCNSLDVPGTYVGIPARKIS